MSETGALTHLSNRLDALERENRRLKATGAFGLVAVAACFLLGMGETKPVPMTTTHLTLVDGQNRSTMEIYGDYNTKGAAIVMTDPSRPGNPQRVSLTAASGGVANLTIGTDTTHARIDERAFSVTDHAGAQNQYVTGGDNEPRVIVGQLSGNWVDLQAIGSKASGHSGSNTTWHQP